MANFIAVTDSPAGDDLSTERSVLAGMQVERVAWHNEASLSTAIHNANAVMCMHAPFTSNVIHSLAHCRVVARFGTGLDNIDLAAAKAVGIPVIGVPGYCTTEVADHAMALLLSWNRKIPEYHRMVMENRWNESRQTTGNAICGPISRLSGKMLGIVGFGQIGRAFSSRALAFNMRVLAYSRHYDPEAASQQGIEFTTFEDLLRRSDYVSLHLPLNNETRHLISTDAISLMKPGAVLINTSRGALVDESVLVEALQRGMLGGALLDVFEHVPLPANHPLTTVKNVILTPHVAFYSEDSLTELRSRAAQAVLDYLRPKSGEASP
jgi:D-3-phosphoglycerate dehydrogenase / 2-oxoglutarate reductase